MAPTRSVSKPRRSRPSVDAQYQTTTNPTAQPSPSSAASEKGTPPQQRASGNPPFFAGTPAYTQYGVAETFGPELQRPSGDKLSAYASTIEHRDLPGASAQTFSTGTIQHGHHTVRDEEAFTCPYHRPILQEHPTNPRSGQGLGPMDRYLAEGPSDRYAILNQPEAGNVSTNNGCRCMEVMQRNIDTEGHGQK